MVNETEECKKYRQIIGILEKIEPALNNPHMADYHQQLRKSKFMLIREKDILHDKIHRIVDDIVGMKVEEIG